MTTSRIASLGLLLAAAACSKLGLGTPNNKVLGTGKVTAHDGDVFRVAITTDGKLAASGGRDHHVKLWKVDDRESVATLDGHEAPVRGVAFSPDGKTLATGDEARVVKVWDVATRKELRSFELEAGVSRMTFSPDGSKLYIGTNAATIAVVAGDAEPAIIQHNTVARSLIVDLVTAADGRLLAIDRVGKAVVYDPAGEPTSTFEHTTESETATFGADGFFTGGFSGSAKAWDAAGATRPAFKCPDDLLVRVLRSTPDGKRVIAGAEDGSVYVFDAATCAKQKAFEAHTLDVYDLVLTPDGKKVITVGKDGGVGFWSLD